MYDIDYPVSAKDKTKAGLLYVATTKEEVTRPEIEEPAIVLTIDVLLSTHFSFNSSKKPSGHSQIPFY